MLDILKPLNALQNQMNCENAGISKRLSFDSNALKYADENED